MVHKVQIMSDEEAIRYNQWQKDLDSVCDNIKLCICWSICIFVFVYIIVYLKEILEKSAINNVTAFALAEVFSRVFTYTNTYEPIEGTGNDTGNGNKKNSFVASSEVQLRPKNQKMMEINGQENMRRVMLIYLSDDYKG